jgi:5-oxoprolinase (ATP-hydrolysing) subunit C
MSVLAVKSCGPMTSLQDFGRFGWQRQGVSNSGAMDRLALAAANALVGNASDVAAIEFMLVGGAFALDQGSARVAVAGAPCPLQLDSEPVGVMRSLTIRAGQTLTVGAAQSGVYAYLAVAGGFAVEPQLGSLSLHARARIGGFGGRPLRADDRLPLRLAEAPRRDELAFDSLPLAADAPVRVVLGPQDDYFTAAGVETFLSAAYLVSPEADRMGYRLTGQRIEPALGYNIVSDGIATGSVQVPGTGEPIVMMADRQTTGGYPKIATVITADLRVIAQRRPGASVRFQSLDIVEAQRLVREAAEFLATLPSRARPRPGGLPDNEALLGVNLAGSAVDALEPD